MQFDKDCLTSRLSVQPNLIQKCFTFYWFTSAFEATQRLMLLSFKSLNLSSISFRLFSICLQHLFTTSHWRFFRAAICMPHAIRSTTHCCVKKEDFFVLSGALELQLLLQFLCHPIHFQLPFRLHTQSPLGQKLSKNQRKIFSLTPNYETTLKLIHFASWAFSHLSSIPAHSLRCTKRLTHCCPKVFQLLFMPPQAA